MFHDQSLNKVQIVRLFYIHTIKVQFVTDNCDFRSDEGSELLRLPETALTKHKLLHSSIDSANQSQSNIWGENGKCTHENFHVWNRRPPISQGQETQASLFINYVRR